MPKNKNKSNIKNRSMNRSMIKSMCVSETGLEGWAHTYGSEKSELSVDEIGGGVAGAVGA